MLESLAESTAETQLQPEPHSDSFKESSDSISNEEPLNDIQEEVQIKNKEKQMKRFLNLSVII